MTPKFTTASPLHAAQRLTADHDVRYLRRRHNDERGTFSMHMIPAGTYREGRHVYVTSRKS